MCPSLGDVIDTKASHLALLLACLLCCETSPAQLLLPVETLVAAGRAMLLALVDAILVCSDLRAIDGLAIYGIELARDQ